MINKDQLPDFLNAMGFSKKTFSYVKTIGAINLEVNFSKEEIIYPDGIVINERQTCNFSSNENFVVLECIHRLLEKGYKPEHIELEPKWKLGHGASGGRADILVKDNSGRSLLIIECKTAGIEFNRAWKKTLQDGDQLFSYAQQISETQFLCLYASDFNSGLISYQSHLIAHRDNPKYLEENPGFQSFKEVTDVKERFAVWRDTYKLDYRTQGLFEANIQPYHVGKDKYTLADLHGIAAADQQKKYHEFATILRQHNVSGRENAFDKLINLFLCKLVDETENPQDLKFYWKGVAFDTHFDLIDRLQQLYQKGMGKFLGETITYIDQSAVKNAMRFIKQNPDATQKAVWGLFLQQKFFTNNDFSLIDVHNEKLFYQNAEILLKILQMWQDIRLTNALGNNQFLGDMFEGFLDQGVKQSEGQYFTPMPICRFIFMSLPLQSMLGGNPVPIKTIDYACGAGHFLNEMATQTRPLIEQQWKGDQVAHLKAQHSAIYGIEKEYRLSKVAKVSAFMYGQQDINICYGDGLVQHHVAFPDIKNNSFDLLVANPPYSVRGFLETLSEEERSAYTLLKTVDKLESSSTIEAFFIERAQQLLKAGGVAAIILPSSILSNGSGTYIKTRELLLQYFDIVAIVELGSGTFGKTGTNTVTLFLRRKKTNPDTAEHYRERVQQWFDIDELQAEYKDAHFIERYAEHIGVSAENYKTLLTGDALGSWVGADYFDVYTAAFNDSAEVKALYRQKQFKALTELEQSKEIDRRYFNYVKNREIDKLYYFVMASDQTHPVLIIKSPSDTKAQKTFLGYDWSTSKGDEGIKLSKNANGHHVTLLYDESDRNHPEKLNSLIANNFEGKLTAIPEALGGFASTSKLVDMLDFSRAGFEKQVSLAVRKKSSVVGRWPLKSISSVAEINSSTVNPVDVFGDRDFVYIDISSIDVSTGNISMVQKIKPIDAPSRARRQVSNGDVLMSTVRPNLKAFVLLQNLPDCVLASTGFAVLKVDSSFILPKYLLECLFSDYVQEQMTDKMGKGQYPSINQSDIESIKIFCPSIDTQQKIVDECEVIDDKSSQAKEIIKAARQKITSIIEAVQHGKYKLMQLQEICKIKRGRFSHRPRNDPKFFGGIYPFIQTGDVVRAVASKVSYTQTLNEDGLAVSQLFQPPIVLITIAANIGDTAVLDYPACFTDSVVGLTPNEEINVKFLELMMRTQKKYLNDIAPQMAQKNINVEILKSIKLTVPALHEQEKLVNQVESLEQAIAQAQATIAAAPAKKQAVMQKYL